MSNEYLILRTLSVCQHILHKQVFYELVLLSWKHGEMYFSTLIKVPKLWMMGQLRYYRKMTKRQKSKTKYTLNAVSEKENRVIGVTL